MARQKKTARRGRPPKDAAAPKRKYTRRKDKMSADPHMPFAQTPAQELVSARSQALHMALETRKLTQGIAVNVNSLIEDADKIRKYLIEGLPERDPVPVGNDSVVGDGAISALGNDTGGQTLPVVSTYNLRDAAE